MQFKLVGMERTVSILCCRCVVALVYERLTTSLRISHWRRAIDTITHILLSPIPFMAVSLYDAYRQGIIMPQCSGHIMYNTLAAK